MEFRDIQFLLERRKDVPATFASKIFSIGPILFAIIIVFLLVSETIDFEESHYQIYIAGLMLFLAQVAIWILIFEIKVEDIRKDYQQLDTNLQTFRDNLVVLTDTIAKRDLDFRGRAIANDDILHQLVNSFRSSAGNSPEFADLLKGLVKHYCAACEGQDNAKLETDIEMQAFDFLKRALDILKLQTTSISWTGRALKEYPEPFYKKKGVKVRATNLGYINDSNGFFKVGRDELLKFNEDRMKRGLEDQPNPIQRIFVVTNLILSGDSGKNEELTILHGLAEKLIIAGVEVKLMIAESVEEWYRKPIADFSLFEWKEEGETHKVAGILNSLQNGRATMHIVYDRLKIAELENTFGDLWDHGPGMIYTKDLCKDTEDFRKLLTTLAS